MIYEKFLIVSFGLLKQCFNGANQLTHGLHLGKLFITILEFRKLKETFAILRKVVRAERIGQNRLPEASMGAIDSQIGPPKRCKKKSVCER